MAFATRSTPRLIRWQRRTPPPRPKLLTSASPSQSAARLDTMISRITPWWTRSSTDTWHRCLPPHFRPRLLDLLPRRAGVPSGRPCKTVSRTLSFEKTEPNTSDRTAYFRRGRLAQALLWCPCRYYIPDTSQVNPVVWAYPAFSWRVTYPWVIYFMITG